MVFSFVHEIFCYCVCVLLWMLTEASKGRTRLHILHVSLYFQEALSKAGAVTVIHMIRVSTKKGALTTELRAVDKPQGIHSSLLPVAVKLSKVASSLTNISAHIACRPFVSTQTPHQRGKGGLKQDTRLASQTNTRQTLQTLHLKAVGQSS